MEIVSTSMYFEVWHPPLPHESTAVGSDEHPFCPDVGSRIPLPRGRVGPGKAGDRQGEPGVSGWATVPGSARHSWAVVEGPGASCKTSPLARGQDQQRLQLAKAHYMWENPHILHSNENVNTHTHMHTHTHSHLSL